MNELTSRSFEPGSGFTLGPWRVEPGRNAIFQGSDERHLENRLMQTLVFLAEHQGQVISRQQFFDSVWKGLVVNEEALSRAISLLRTALDDDAHAPRFIQTIPGIGYRLIANVLSTQSREDDATPANGVQNTIAVLPFVNLSEDTDNEYFSDGISEEILNVLAQVKRFKVVGRTSSFAFKGRNEDLREIGGTLNASHVLEGSVRKAGARVRITAQLIKTNDGFHLWSKTFDRELDDIFAVQDEIAFAVTKALKVKLLGEAGNHQIIGGTHNTRAFQAYLLGVHYRNRGVLKETVRYAVDAFGQAIELDPEYARAYAGLAYAWHDLVCNGYATQEAGLSQMNIAAAKAIELAPELADGHLALGLSLQLDFLNRHKAQKAINTAMKLLPGAARVLIEYSRINCNIGNHKISIATARKALELEPVSVYANHFLGHALYFARHYEEAIPAFRQTLKLDPHYTKPHYFIAMSLYWLGQTEAALEEAQLEPLNWMRWTASAVILHRLGRTAEAEANFASLAEIGIEENNFIQQADIFTQLGHTDRAFESLDVAYRYRDPGCTQLLIDPFFDPIRDDPRFIEIMTKVGFAAT
jgi:TolB-like protein/Flp pilus assembly protein TadD